MTAKTNPLRIWMDSRHLKASDVAPRFGVSEQTIHNWRSAGVPARTLPNVQRIMNEWPTAAAAFGACLPIHARNAQLRAWNQAALDQGMLMEDWITAQIDKAAEHHFNNFTAVEPTPLKHAKKA